MVFPLSLDKELLNTAFVIFFYSAILLFVFLNRKKFEIQSGFIALYRTKVGLGLMDRVGKKHKEFIKILGYIGIGIGYVGMFYISFVLIQNLYNVITVPGAQSAVAPAIPGVKIPGSPIFIPLITGWIALFLVTLMHEFSHGVVATANGLKVKSSGIVFIGPIMGAFVEPDEKAMKKKDNVAQYSIFAAGPFSNILLSIAAVLMMLLLFSPLINTMTVPAGFTFEGVTAGMPAAAAGITPGMIFTSVNNESVKNDSLFVEVMSESIPNQTVALGTNNQSYVIVMSVHPDDPSKGYVGVTGIKGNFELKNKNIFLNIIYQILLKLTELLWLIFLLSSGIGIVNLLPLGPIDGGRMLHLSLVSTKGEKKGTKIWSAISLFFLVILLLNIFVPLLLPLIRKLISI
jgi:membrane-associated protease RseP (regulator of RpoE activity)